MKRAFLAVVAAGCALATAGLSTGTAMNASCGLTGAGAALTASIGCGAAVRSAVTTQRRSRLALSPFASATAAIDTPGLRHAATTFALNSPLCLRRRRRATWPLSEVFTCPPKS